MGTLTKKLHILKTGGTEETCNIYTTPEEVGGSPYLALEVDGQKGYVKLGSTTDVNATHLRVKKNDTTYAAWKQAEVAVPTGSMLLTYNTVNFTVPAGVTVLYMHNRYLSAYVGVTPNTTHGLSYDENYRDDVDGEIYTFSVFCDPHGYITGTMEETTDPPGSITVEWSPEINKHPVNVKHYNK